MQCEVCGNDYDKSLTVIKNDEEHTFDSCECAIHALAPVCDHCGCRVVGHAVEKDGAIYCCVHCAKHDGVKGLKDRADSHHGRQRGHRERAPADEHIDATGRETRPGTKQAVRSSRDMDVSHSGADESYEGGNVARATDET